MPKVDLGATKLHYEIDGTGRPILLLAGLASDSASWIPLLPEIAHLGQIIRPDNRSTGRTTGPDDALSVEVWADDALRLCDTLGIAQVDIIGHSLGGLIAMEMAKRAPERVKSLCLMATPTRHLPRNTMLFEDLLHIRQSSLSESIWLRSFFAWIFHPSFFDDPERVAATITLAESYPFRQKAKDMARQVAALRSSDPKALIEAIDCPTLALIGADDIILPSQMVKEGLRDLSDLTLHEIPRAAHSLHWDAPEQVGQHLRDFYARRGNT